MQASLKNSRRKGIALRSVALAVALALPNVASLAANMRDVVSTQSAQSIGERYGRDSVYALSPNAKPLQIRTDPTTLAMPNSANSVHQRPANGPQAYGRAGRYIGWERIVMMQKNASRHKDNIADPPTGDDIYHRKSAARSGGEVNADLRATHQDGGQSAANANAIPEANKLPSWVAAPP